MMRYYNLKNSKTNSEDEEDEDENQSKKNESLQIVGDINKILEIEESGRKNTKTNKADGNKNKGNENLRIFGDINKILQNEVGEETSLENLEKNTKKKNKNPDDKHPNEQNTSHKIKNQPKYLKLIAPEVLEKYSHGEGINLNSITSKTHRKKLLRREKQVKFAEVQAARAEILLTEESGFLIPEEGEHYSRITQNDIKKSVDITSAAKSFELDLNFGPYRMNYTRNGRHLLLGGKRGHVAAFDWITKGLLCEINVMESVFDVQWLHIETMFAVAQKEWVYIYDNQGIELHCLKKLSKVLRMSFLPYHFLLATSNEQGWLSWLDVSIGELVTQFNTKQGRLSVMTQNPYNAVLCLGHSKGVVSMWSPNSAKPLAKILCHKTGVQAIAVDHTGLYMATSSADRNLRIWDVRQLVGPLQNYILRGSPSDLSFSQKGLLAAGINNTLEVFKNCHTSSVTDSYLKHRSKRSIYNLQFCPFEDILGLGTWGGFTSMLVPGAGEANFDALECNPIQSKSQRREAEVKSLLEKIQPEMIGLDPTIITEIDLPTLKDKVEAKKKLLYLKPPKIDFEPRRKRRHGNTVRAAKVKKIVRESEKKTFLKGMKEVGKELLSELDTETSKDNQIEKKRSVLDRFRPKK